MPNSKENQTKKQRGMRVAVAALALVAVLGAGVWAIGGATDVDATNANTPTFTVARGPLTISVIESGTIAASEQAVIKSEVEGRRTIIYLIPEGQHVEKGDLLVELDASELQNELIEQEIEMQEARAELVQAEEDLAVAHNQAEADIAQAELDYAFAKQDLAKYIEGEYPMELMKLQTEITLKKEQLEQAANTLEWSRRLFDEKYISANELEKDELAKNRAELEHQLAEEDLALLKNYTYKREVAELESNVEQMRMALERTRRSARADVVRAEARLYSEQGSLKRETEQLDNLKEQIANSRMTAPTDGMVVYATSAGGGWRNQEPLEEGQEVRERQELIYLPTADAKMAKLSIHESALDKVKIGQPVRVTMDALPEQAFSGKVTKVSPLPDAQSIWLNPDLKVYDTQVMLEGKLDAVRTGMSCRAEILVEQFREATYVPVQAVVRVGSQPTVYVQENDRFQPRAVTTGLNNNRMVRIIDGVKPGEVVSLAPPLASGEADQGDGAFTVEDDADGTDGAAPAAADGASGSDAGGADNAAGEADAAPAQPDQADQAGDQERFRERMKNMTPEQREAMRKQWAERQGQGQGQPAAGDSQ